MSSLSFCQNNIHKLKHRPVNFRIPLRKQCLRIYNQSGYCNYCRRVTNRYVDYDRYAKQDVITCSNCGNQVQNDAREELEKAASIEVLANRFEQYQDSIDLQLWQDCGQWIESLIAIDRPFAEQWIKSKYVPKGTPFVQDLTFKQAYIALQRLADYGMKANDSNVKKYIQELSKIKSLQSVPDDLGEYENQAYLNMLDSLHKVMGKYHINNDYFKQYKDNIIPFVRICYTQVCKQNEKVLPLSEINKAAAFTGILRFDDENDETSVYSVVKSCFEKFSRQRIFVEDIEELKTFMKYMRQDKRGFLSIEFFMDILQQTFEYKEKKTQFDKIYRSYKEGFKGDYLAQFEEELNLVEVTK
eukprot:TRINITY_DN362_c0_g1_i2.p1 TRINITY_DN362_c0_g1~~TRINITY_DN362_c0_g1_i2.p1  ORF type:complete len:377 (+),score=25.33 TRINITY_DN362_c0_g1_i2:61-1131(+)